MNRPKQFDPDAVIDQAMLLFWRKGYTSTTPQQLADELGVAKGSLYHAFNSKRGVFDLAFTRYGDARLAVMAEMLHGPGSVKERLRQMLTRLIAGRGDASLRGCMGVNTAVELGDQDEDASRAVKKLFDGTEALLRDAVAEGQRLGEIDASRDAAQLASLLFSSMLGLQVLGRAGDGPARMRRIVDAAIAAL